MKKYAFLTLALFATSTHAQMVTTGTLNSGQDRTTGVSAGSYICSNVTFDATGRATAAANGSCSGGGGSSPTTSIKTANYTLATGDCWSTVMMGTGSTGQITATLPSPTGFTAGCTIYIKNGDTARGKVLSGFPAGLTSSILWPLQTVGVQVVNSAWQVVYNPGRWKVPSQQTIHVDAVNGNNANDGLTTGSGGAVQDAQEAWLRAAYDFDNDGHTPIIAMACSQTHTVALSMGGIPLGTNLVQLSPDGNCSFTWSNAGAAITISDLAELDIRLNHYGSSGGMTCSANTSNATDTGCIYMHNDSVLDIEGATTWVPGGANDNFLYCDGACGFAIANGVTHSGSGTGNYYIYMSAGGKGTASGSFNASGSGSDTGVFYLYGRAMLNLGGPAGAGWASLGPTKIYANSVLVNNGVSIPGGVAVGASSVNCSSLTTNC